MSKSSKYKSEVEKIEKNYNVDLETSDEEIVANSTPLIRKTIIMVLAAVLTGGIAAYIGGGELFLPVFIAFFAAVNSHRIEKSRRETESLIISLKKEIAALQDEKEEENAEVAEIPVIEGSDK